MNGMDRAYQMTGTRRQREHAMGLSRFHPVLTQIAGPLAHRDDIASQVDILNTIPREDQLIAHLSIRQAHDHTRDGGPPWPRGLPSLPRRPVSQQPYPSLQRNTYRFG